MTKPEQIVEYIKSHPGCIIEMYSEEDQDKIDESLLLNPDDWELVFSEPSGQIGDWTYPNHETWGNFNKNIILGYWDHTTWVSCSGWCGGIEVNFEDDKLIDFQEA